MVSVWALPPIGASIEADGVLRLSNGRTFTLDDIPGRGWNTSRLRKLTEAVQAIIDDIQPTTDIPSGDLDKGAIPAELLARYGERRFLDDKGNIVSRSVEINFSYERPDAEPEDGIVGVLPEQLIMTFVAVK